MNTHICFPSRQSVNNKIGRLGGLSVLALVNEPTAAAIAFGLQKRVQDALIVVCDLGGGTFDVTAMNVSGGELQVLANVRGVEDCYACDVSAYCEAGCSACPPPHSPSP